MTDADAHESALAERALRWVGQGDYDRARVKGILERAAQRPGYEMVIAVHLKAAFAEIGVQRALEIFEREDLVELERNLRLIPHLISPDTQLCTLGELADHAAGFRAHLEANRESLIQRGTTSARFSACPWLERRLGHLYYLEIPQIDLERRRDSLGRLRPDHWAGRAAAGARRHDPVTGRLDLDPEDAERLASARAKLLDLKIQVLRCSERALRAERTEGFWDDCRLDLAKSLNREEAEFFLRQDRFYRDADALAKHVAGPEPGVVGSVTLPGGFSDLLEVMGYVECELRFRAMHDTKAELVLVAEQLGLNDWRAVLGESYLPMVDRPWRVLLDEVLDRYAAREADPRPWRFWSEYKGRVNQMITDDLDRNVVVRTTIKRRFQEEYVPYVQGVAELAKSRLYAGGTLPEIALPPSREDNESSLNSIGRRGQSWEICFQGEAIRLPALTGCAHVAHLIEREGQELWAGELSWLVTAPAAPRPEPDAVLIAEDAETEVEIGSDALPVIEDDARERLNRKIAELKARIERHKASGDTKGLERMRGDLADLIAYRRSVTNVRGQSRRTGGPSALAFKRVKSAIDYAIKKLKADYPRLGKHLDESIHRRRNPFAYRPQSSRIHPTS